MSDVDFFYKRDVRVGCQICTRMAHDDFDCIIISIGRSAQQGCRSDPKLPTFQSDIVPLVGECGHIRVIVLWIRYGFLANTSVVGSSAVDRFEHGSIVAYDMCGFSNATPCSVDCVTYIIYTDVLEYKPYK